MTERRPKIHPVLETPEAMLARKTKIWTHTYQPDPAHPVNPPPTCRGSNNFGTDFRLEDGWIAVTCSGSCKFDYRWLKTSQSPYWAKWKPAKKTN